MIMNKHIFVPLLLALAFAAVYQAQGCSLAATEYTSAGCSAANLVGCQRFTDLVENTDCTAITSSLNSSQTLYVKISNCSSSTYSVHLDSACTSDAVTVANDCSSSAPFFSFALFADGTNATLAPYCAQGANQTCRIALLSYNNLECTEYLGCIDNLARGGDKDGVCIYEQRLGLYLLPRCQTEELVISNQPSCTGGLTKTFPKIPISLQGAGTCSPYGSNDTTFAAYFLASNEGGCGSASVMTSWISLLFSFLF